MDPSCIDPSCNTIWKDWIHSGFSFQHVNDPKLTVSAVQEYLGKDRKINTVTVLDWPPQSWDFNIIAAVQSSWQRSEEKAPTTKKYIHYIKQHKESWGYIKNLVSSSVCPILPHALYCHICLHIHLINCCSDFPFFYQNIKQWWVAQDLWVVLYPHSVRNSKNANGMSNNAICVLSSGRLSIRQNVCDQYSTGCSVMTLVYVVSSDTGTLMVFDHLREALMNSEG